jgi:LacI family transcriptional regulator
MLLSRGVEGFLTVDTVLTDVPYLPTVAVAGHRQLENVTNIVLDHRHAAEQALQHLKDLGHKKIAFLRGQPESADSSVRWDAICEVAGELEIEISPERVVQLTGVESTPELGYPFGKELLARRVPFTALFAYNDISAIGAMRAFQEAGLRVPEDVSVVGFDDIAHASFCIPSLTTVRQPLKKMGRIAAETLLAHIEGTVEPDGEIAVEPELVIRKSTTSAPEQAKTASQ